MFDLRLLPHNPTTFFSLEAGFDRRDLKRIYGQAIRQYNPETHPSEFQLVRDAYERLEKELRYGKKQQEFQDASNAWSVGEATKSSAAEPTTRSPTPTPTRGPKQPTFRELAVIDSKAALAQFQTMTRKTPQDYYVAAILADATAGRLTLQYFVQLLDGLAAFPTDPGLNSLASEFLGSEIRDETIVKTVQFVAQKLRTSAFYSLTESLWIRLVNILPFAEFQRLLELCEKQLHQTDLSMRTTFYLRLIEPAMWVAPPDWTANALRELEGSSANLDYSSQFDLEFVAELQQLIGMESSRSDSDPVRKTLMQVFRLTCQSDELAARMQIIEHFSQLSRDAAAMQRAFPMSMTEVDALWLTLVHRVLYRIQAFTVEPDAVSPERQLTHATNLLNDLQPTEAQIDKHVSQAHWKFSRLPLIVFLLTGIGLGAVPLVIVLTMAFPNSSGGTLFRGIVFLVVCLLGLYAGWVYPKFLRERYQRAVLQALAAAYSLHWRARVFRYVQASHETVELHIEQIQWLGARMNRKKLAETIRTFLARDTGLKIFAAVRTIMR